MPEKIKGSLVMSANKNLCLAQPIVFYVENKDLIFGVPGTRSQSDIVPESFE